MRSCRLFFCLNIFILHRLRNKFLQLIQISLDSAFWELHQYSHQMCGPMKKSQSWHPLPGIELGTSRLRGRRSTSQPWTPAVGSSVADLIFHKIFGPFLLKILPAPPRWLSSEHVGPMTWWLRVRSLVEANFLSGVFLPLTSAKACEKSSQWLWKEKLCQYWCQKARKHMCVTDHHDMTQAVKVTLNPNTTKPIKI